MTVQDLWKGLAPAQIAQKRTANVARYLRRWRVGEGRDAVQHKQRYNEADLARAYIDEVEQTRQVMPHVRPGSVTVNTLLTRYLAAKGDRAPRTVQDYHYRAFAVRKQFGERNVTTVIPTEIEVWATRPNVAAESRKKQLEVLRAAIRRGIRDGIVEMDPTEDITVSLGHKERAYWSYAELSAVLAAASSDLDRALLGVQGLMGLRSGEARALVVGDIRNGSLKVTNSGAGYDRTKTRASMRTLPIPQQLLPLLAKLTAGRLKSAWLFESPRRRGELIGTRYCSVALRRAIERANADREKRIPAINVHGLRHTFAAITLSEVGADILLVSRALGHSRPSTTLNHYGHLASGGLEVLKSKIDMRGAQPLHR